MHELSIALSLIDVASEEARRRAARVVALHVRVGPLSGVVNEALASAYELAREGSPLADARLVIEETPLVIHCPACGQERPAVSVYQLCCAECGTPAARVTGGRELELFALEIDE
jgi:hydrogenase nickel incorporation protein HypA/HybF